MSVNTKNISLTLARLNHLYNAAGIPTSDATFYSKLAILELGGWIETTMDDIAEKFASKHIRSTAFQNMFKELKKQTNNFGYENNFRKLLGYTIGLNRLERIENKVSVGGGITVLIATLNPLKDDRNSAAHTSIGVTTTYDAPSVTLAKLHIIAPILSDIEKQVNKLR